MLHPDRRALTASRCFHLWSRTGEPYGKGIQPRTAAATGWVPGVWGWRKGRTRVIAAEGMNTFWASSSLSLAFYPKIPLRVPSDSIDLWVKRLCCDHGNYQVNQLWFHLTPLLSKTNAEFCWAFTQASQFYVTGTPIVQFINQAKSHI